MAQIYIQGRSEPLIVPDDKARSIANDKKERPANTGITIHSSNVSVDTELGKINRIEYSVEDRRALDMEDKYNSEEWEYNQYILKLRSMSPYDRATNKGVQSFIKSVYKAHFGKDPSENDVIEMTNKCSKFFEYNPRRTKPDPRSIIDDFDGRRIAVGSLSFISAVIRQDKFREKY